MGKKYVEIKIQKGVLYLTESELLDHLPRELYMEALRRGKAFQRSKEFKKRQAQRQS